MAIYHPVPLHMHSIWERNASMEGHFYNAQKLGIHHMYLTDHDIRMGPRKNQIRTFDFSKNMLKIEEPSNDPLRPRWHGFTPMQKDEGTSFGIKDGTLFMEATSASEEWNTAVLVFDSSQKRHEYALIANVLLHLHMQVSAGCEDTRIMVDVELSQRPPEFKHGHILYVFGNTDDLASPYSTVVPMCNLEGFQTFSLSLLKDAAAVGGGDNVLRTVRFSVSARNGKTAKLLLNHLSFSWDIAFEEGRIAQQKLANEIGKKYEVTPIVTSEITAAGPHKICFSTSVPILDYPAHDYKISDEEAMEHVRMHGGIYARNHPFELLKDALKTNGSTAEIQKRIDEHIDLFVKKRAWDATMLEVGFTEGREGFSLDLHLRLWDALSATGVFITGYGDSDNHTNDTSWFDENNFVAYIAAEKPSEEAFIHSMRAGNLYTGDPVYLQKIDVSFTGSNALMMGQVSTVPEPGEAILSLSNLPENCTVIWTANGETVRTDIAESAYCGTLPIPTHGTVDFVRAAVYKGERCILLTNPIYHTTDADIIKMIPPERRTENV